MASLSLAGAGYSRPDREVGCGQWASPQQTTQHREGSQGAQMAISSRKWDAVPSFEALADDLHRRLSREAAAAGSTPNGPQCCRVMYMLSLGAYRIVNCIVVSLVSWPSIDVRNVSPQL